MQLIWGPVVNSFRSRPSSKFFRVESFFLAKIIVGRDRKFGVEGKALEKVNAGTI